jgi:hypothetical protein
MMKTEKLATSVLAACRAHGWHQADRRIEWHIFPGDRTEIRRAAMTFALELLAREAHRTLD